MDIQPTNPPVTPVAGQPSGPAPLPDPANPATAAPPQAPVITPQAVPANPAGVPGGIPGDPSLTTVQTAVMSDTPEAADNNDIIEKEWVDKAKQIVEMSRSDPYAQNEQINKIKADYIKKRYNKDIKVSEG